jgi:hypothetical protein
MITLKLTLTDGERSVETEVAEDVVYSADMLVLSRCLMTAVRLLKAELNKQTK